jgi:hypothetical protein
MFELRYESVPDSNGTWSVVDTFTGRICEIGQRQVTRLQERDMIEFLEILNGMPAAMTAH